MRVAIISDIHGNITAFDAVLADLKDAAPDMVLHGGDLADGGSSPGEIIDRIRDLGWQGVLGNGDEMLCRPASLDNFAAQSSAPASLWTCIREIADATRAELGPERLSWLGELPISIARQGFALVHATPQSCWKAAPANASDKELCRIYGALKQQTVVSGHVHIPSIRTLNGTPRMLINAGSVGLPFDEDPRASYLLLDDGKPVIRRVDYSIQGEVALLSSRRVPHSDWIARTIRLASPQMP